MRPIDEQTEGDELLPAVTEEQPQTLPAIDLLVKLQSLRAGTKGEVAQLRELEIPSAEFMPAPGGRANDFFARTGGAVRQKAFVYRDGRMVETTMDGGDVEGTYDLVLKELHIEEEAELKAIQRELEDKRIHLAALRYQDGKEEEAQSVHTRIEELEKRFRELRPVMTEKRQELEERILDIPLGTILFIKVQNTETLYPVIVVEEDGIKLLETMAENMPNGRVAGGMHSKGFRVPLRNYTNGGLYLPTGMRGQNVIESNSQQALPSYIALRLEDKI